jgi:predicted ATP-dependent endonuclease of OLD family
LDEVAGTLWEAAGKPEPKFTAETLRPRLHALMTPWMSEGFFADTVVLVEGEDDRAAILGTASSLGHDLESAGVSVIPCGGKNSLDRPMVIFQKLHIPTYLVWDGDEGKKDAKPESNRYLLRLMGQQEEDWPAIVSDRFACFKRDLGTTLLEEIGVEVFDQLLQKAQDEVEIETKERALKNPMVIQKVIVVAKKEVRSSQTLESVIQKILALKPVAVER